MLMLLGTITTLCFLFGVVYPVVAILAFPIYSRITGDKDFRSYIRNL
jgi:hypothetical protein